MTECGDNLKRLFILAFMPLGTKLHSFIDHLKSFLRFDFHINSVHDFL